ncbi:unnamed protein product [Tilletia controversa]|uniref:triacylglycerol lipase n=2 Tax=Tilletia TaxID=13289 RepID=A0A8X7MNR6_9BASI|nr:hypothetical protein CF336_g6551 [Tilletia laevis]KAE8189140.1 hypothetical protein CF328_g6377 [Tilletia controversa]KAE8252360.1 hypothetical protein A4X03_0g6184 [Tilletia caries]KAE8191051.1 hypothetical protein CF335_g6192 [Tilletia laevis]KAE8242223.1 hypothetical protein A4X06_0g7112 [Tilletia controversa]
MQLAKSFVLLAAVLTNVVIAYPYSERSVGRRLIFGVDIGVGSSSDKTVAAGLPSQDAFYKPPSGWQRKANGAILRSRQVRPSSSNAAAAYQILFKTTDALGAPDHTVTTILVPQKPQSPAKIVSIQLPQDSPSLDCAPSAALVAHSKSNFAVIVPFVNQGLEPSLQNGYYVNVPDHEGSRALAFVGDMEGHAVLDSLKATTSFPTAIPGVSIKTPIVLGGYSGGAHASAWGSQLYPLYAPNLNIIGQVIGGTPVRLSNIVNYLNKYKAYPDIKNYIDAHVLPNGTALIEDIQDNKCIGQVVLNYSGKDLFSLFKIKEPLSANIPQKRLNQNMLGNDGSTLKVKTIMYHSEKDDIIPFGDAQKYAADQCAKGASLNFIVDTGRSHAEEEFGRGDDLGKWIEEFHKGTADSSCK